MMTVIPRGRCQDDFANRGFRRAAVAVLEGGQQARMILLVHTDIFGACTGGSLERNAQQRTHAQPKSVDDGEQMMIVGGRAIAALELARFSHVATGQIGA